MTFAPNRIQQNRAPKIKFLFALPISKKSGYLHRMRSANLPFFCGFYSVRIRAFFSLFGLWETLGDSADALGGFGKLWGGFGRLWEAFGKLCEALGKLWETLGEALGSFGEALKAFQSLSSPRAFSSSPIYKKNQTPDQPL